MSFHVFYRQGRTSRRENRTVSLSYLLKAKPEISEVAMERVNPDKTLGIGPFWDVHGAWEQKGHPLDAHVS